VTNRSLRKQDVKEGGGGEEKKRERERKQKWVSRIKKGNRHQRGNGDNEKEIKTISLTARAKIPVVAHLAV
jgi:hypothetical protein